MCGCIYIYIYTLYTYHVFMEINKICIFHIIIVFFHFSQIFGKQLQISTKNNCTHTNSCTIWHDLGWSSWIYRVPCDRERCGNMSAQASSKVVGPSKSCLFARISMETNPRKPVTFCTWKWRSPWERRFRLPKTRQFLGVHVILRGCICFCLKHASDALDIRSCFVVVSITVQDFWPIMGHVKMPDYYKGLQYITLL